MGKGTNFSGQPVLSQLIKLMDRSKINTPVKTLCQFIDFANSRGTYVRYLVPVIKILHLVRQIFRIVLTTVASNARLASPSEDDCS